MASAAGRLVGIAHRSRQSAPMEECAEGLVTVARGLEGDFKGAKYRQRQITVLACEAWEAALSEIDHATLSWTARRANLPVAGVRLPRAVGGVVRIGPVHREVTGQTLPLPAHGRGVSRPPAGPGEGLARRGHHPCYPRWRHQARRQRRGACRPA